MFEHTLKVATPELDKWDSPEWNERTNGSNYAKMRLFLKTCGRRMLAALLRDVLLFGLSCSTAFLVFYIWFVIRGGSGMLNILLGDDSSNLWSFLYGRLFDEHNLLKFYHGDNEHCTNY